MKIQRQESIYARAEKRVEKIRNFYIHFIVYVAVNLIISTLKIYRNMNDGESIFEAFFDFGTIALWLLWGIGLGLHAFSVYGIDRILGKNWEERKINEFMQDELKDRER